MRTQWTTKGNRDAGSSCLCDQGLHRYLRNFGGGFEHPKPPPRYATGYFMQNSAMVQTANWSLAVLQVVFDKGLLIWRLLGHSFCKNWERIWNEKILIFQDKSSIMWQKILSCKASFDAWGQNFENLLRTRVSWTAEGKWSLNSQQMQVSYVTWLPCSGTWLKITLYYENSKVLTVVLIHN